MVCGGSGVRRPHNVAAMLRILLVALALVLATRGQARAGAPIRCDDLATADLAVDGMLDDWARPVLARVGTSSDGQVELRCSWDGTALALAVDIKDDRVVRVRGAGHQDHLTLQLAAGGKPIVIDAYPGNAIAKARITRPARVRAADSLQPKGFSLEVVIPTAALPGLTASTPSLELQLTFHDSDQATGGDDADVALDATIELGDRKDLLEDFLAAVRLKRAQLTFDRMANLDPDRKGNERIVAGGTVIGVLTDKFAYVSLPAARREDVLRVELVPLGPRGLQVVSAVVRQAGNGGSRELLMLWTVWSGQLQPLGQVELRKQQGANVLEATVRRVAGKAGAELWVESKPAVGWTAETWNEQPAEDADPILLPWDVARGGIAYSLKGAELQRRDLPAPRGKRR